jgi:hypothetical protein
LGDGGRAKTAGGGEQQELHFSDHKIMLPCCQPTFCNQSS